MSGKLLLISVLQAVTILVGLLRAKWLALLLGPAGFGVASTIDQVVLTSATLGSVAVPFTAMKFMARGYDDGEAAFRRCGIGFLRLIAALALIATLIVSAGVAWRPGVLGADMVAYRPLLRIAVIGVAPGMLLMFLVTALAAARRPATAAFVNLLSVLTLGAAAIAGAWWNGLIGLYYLVVATAIVTTALFLVYLARTLGIRLNAQYAGIIASLREEPAIAGYSLCFYASFAGTSVMMLAMRTIVLSSLGEAAVGQFQAVLSIALTVGAILYPLSNLFLGPLANSRGCVEEKSRVAEDVASRMLLLLLAGVTPVLLFPELLLSLLYSSAFVPASGALWLFILWQCIFQISYVYQQLLIGLDDVGFAAGTLVLGAFVATAVAAFLVDRVGLAGVALGLTSGMSLWGIAVVARLRVRHGVRVSPRVVLRLATVLSIVSGGGALFAAGPESDPSAITLRFAAAAGVAALSFSLLDPQERSPRAWLAALRPTGAPSSP